MAKNINKYWENEDPITTTTENMEFHYFPEAGKFQMYGLYQNEDGETRRTKAIVLDTGDIKMSEAQDIIKAMMECLFDVNISDATMSAIVKMATEEPARVGGITLDEDFEDEVTAVDYSTMSYKDLKAECDKRGITYKKVGESKANLVNLLETYDDEHDDTSALVYEPVDTTSDDADGGYDGKWLSFKDGKVVAAPQRTKVNKANAAEWLDYFQTCVGEVEAMVKKVTNKKAKTVDIVKLKKAMDKWVVSFEADDDTTAMLNGWVEHFFSDVKADKPVQIVPDRLCELCMIIDQM